MTDSAGDLRIALVDLVRVVNDYSEEEGLTPWTTRDRAVIEVDENHRSIQFSTEPDVGTAVSSLFFHRKHHFHDVIDLIDHRYGAALKLLHWPMIFDGDVVSKVAEAAVQMVCDLTTKHGQSPESAATAVVEQLEAFSRTESLEMEIRFPVTGLILNGESLRISESIDVVPMDRKAQSAFLTSIARSSSAMQVSPAWMAASYADAEIVVRKVLKPDTEQISSAQVEWRNALRAIRLTGVVGSHVVGRQYAFPHFSLIMRRLIPMAATTFDGLPEIFDPAEGSSNTGQITAVFAALTELEESDEFVGSPLQLALSRFDESFRRATDVDSLIDAWIGLEALFTNDGGGELTFKASMRIAALLGASPSDRIGIARSAKRLYNLRSRIVHGAHHGDDLGTGAQESLELLRKSLVAWILEWSPRTADDLDLALLGKVNW